LKSTIDLLQNLDSLAFVLLGIATGVGWMRRPSRSLRWLAIAIVLISLVSVLGRIPDLLHVTPPAALGLLMFVCSGYALLRYRASLIPLPPRWHAMAVVAMASASVCFLASQYLPVGGALQANLQTAAAIAVVLIWSAAVGEPIVRFWLVAGGLPAVQAMRLRSLSLGFAGIVAVLLFAVGAGAALRSQPVQLAIQVIVLLIVPLLYVSFSPPAWLRREWRASEEEGLRGFMEDLLLLHEDRVTLADRALDWAMRLAGGASAVAFTSDGSVLAARGLDKAQMKKIHERIAKLQLGVHEIDVQETGTSTLVVPIGAGEAGRLAVLAGPFTPGFGADEISRVQQFMTAVAAALDRARLLERLREANRRLVEADKHKSVFLASMSHELRTPLNAILGFSELLLDSPGDQTPAPTKRRFLEQIHSSGKHLLGLINDILDLSKIEAGQMELRLSTVSVAEVVQQVISTIEPLAAQKQIHLETNVESAGEIEADRVKFKQMLLNLASNAIKFTASGGTVTFTGQRMLDTVEVAVADSGIGIAKEDLSRIFHEFQQLDSSVGRQQTGTGLGLSLTRRFAMLHGGDVRVRSEPAQGSVFTISMPLVAVRPARQQTPYGLLADQGTRDTSLPLVLVVEDDPAAAELLARHLDRGGFRIEIVSTGSDVVAKARDLQPAAITLDIMLPDVDGWEVLSRLKDDDATCDIPVIVISVVDNPELGLALGAFDYFVKPVDAEELISRLHKFNLSPKASRQDVHVLVADDEQANRKWISRILEPAGFMIIEASGGAEAIELAKSRKPDMVILDLLMPGVTGFDVVESLRSDETTRHTPIMILTAGELTDADKRHLNGQVSTILRRGSTGAAGLLGLLRELIAKRGGETVAVSES
jgi:signal transduction histidine kinase/DNA-binding response OmpR family regulator